WFALLAIGVTMTRPDGIVYGIAYPIVVLVRERAVGRPLRKAAWPISVYLAIFGLIAALLLWIRVLYFGDWLPNTYYAKGGPSARNLLTPDRLASLINRVTWSGGGLWLLGMAAATLFLIRQRRMGWEHVVSFMFLCVSTFVFLLLPEDGFPEFRFATPFFA